MNYRHIFHAGHICDVVKHALLVLLLEHLREKDKAFCVLDTHAGTGLYDLKDPQALKTGEAQTGIYKLLTKPPLPALAEYYRILKEINPDWQPQNPKTVRFYPGSPVIVQHMLRPEDRLIACELQEEDARALRKYFRNIPQVQAHHRNGYEALGAFLPPPEKRGLVLIDPPYENADEFERLITSIIKAHTRWPQGIFMIWYPVKERPAIWRFHEALIASQIPKQLCAEFLFEEETRGDRLNGSGQIIINPPWQLDEKIGYLFSALHETLQTNHQGSIIKWLAT